MKQSKFTTDQIASILKEFENQKIISTMGCNKGVYILRMGDTAEKIIVQ